MRIIQFIDSLKAGGAERMAVNISNALAEEGHQVVLAVSRDNGSLENQISNKVSLCMLRKRSFFDLKALLSWISLINKFKPDVIHAHSTSVYWAALSKFMSPHPYKLIFHDHYGMGERLENGDRRALRILSPKIDRVIVVNDILKKWNIYNLKVKPNNIAYIPNFPYLNLNKKAKNNDYIQILCLANLRPQKDHLTLIHALSLALQNNPKLSVKLILAGLTLQDEYQHQVEKLIREQHLNSFVEIRGSTSNVEQLLAESDIGVLSSISEGLPLSLLEYGLAGLPVIVTNVGHCAKVIENGRHGLLVSPQNPKDLAEAITFLIENPSIAKNMALSFRIHVEANYGYNTFKIPYYQLLGIDFTL